MNSVSVVHLSDAPHLEGRVVVVVDVIRAFTTAAAAFGAGAKRILCVETLDQAFALRQRHRDAVLIGEQRGERPAGFDLGNSPLEVGEADLDGKLVIQRTSNGTRGLVAASGAASLLAAAATNVTATACWIRLHRPDTAATIMCTGTTTEDVACAKHLDAMLSNRAPDPTELALAVRHAFQEHTSQWSDPRFVADVDACSRVDHYKFPMVGMLRNDAVELRSEPSSIRRG